MEAGPACHIGTIEELVGLLDLERKQLIAV
jgi:hypothetical protein